MKKILLLIVLISTSVFAQKNQKSWNKVITLEKDGKIKSAKEIVDRIYERSISKNDEEQLIKCFFYQSKYLQTLDENAQSKILNHLKTDISRVSAPSKAILNLVYAKCLNDYLNQNRYKRENITTTSNPDNNYLLWSNAEFENQIAKYYNNSLIDKASIKNTSLAQYEAIFDYYNQEIFKSENLYEYLLDENINYYNSKIQHWNFKKSDFNFLKENLFGNSVSFKEINFDFVKEKNLQKTLQLFQEREQNNPSVENQLNRIIFCKNHLVNDNEAYLKALTKLQKQSKTAISLQKIQFEKATIFNNLASKETHPDYKIKSIALFDSIIAIQNHSNTYKQAHLSRHKLLEKNLSIQLEKYIYPNQNHRAFISFKNIDSVKISFYKIKQSEMQFLNFNYTKKDSILNEFILHHIPVQTENYSLKNPKDYFDHTTELLLPQLKTGMYLAIFESTSTKKDDKAYGFETIIATNFSLLSETKKDRDYYHVLDRKTGTPIENVQIDSEDFVGKTDKTGTLFNTRGKDENFQRNIVLTKDNDTLPLYTNYINILNEFEKNKTVKAKVQFYLDRAIYRPGQTVYYKGIALQQKANVTTVVANTSFKINFEDVNNNTIKEFDVITNEFGSFSGEFKLPQTGLTGNFTIQAEEPDDYEKDSIYDKTKEEHPFWDNVTFENSYLSFRVEEYKRPKFEITINPLTETYKVNQKLTVTGNANSFSGANVTDAKVTYEITQETYNTDHYNSYQWFGGKQERIVKSETKTDNRGNFSIDFIAKPDTLAIKEKLPIFSYRIRVTITDINGETQTKEDLITNVGYHALKLKADFPKTIETKNKTSIKLESNNLNDISVPTNGEIKIYRIRNAENKFKPRVWQKPEIEIISDSEFEQLFPFEKNEKPISEKETRVLVHSLKVNTIKDKEIPLDFMTDYPSGNYKLVFSAKDAFDNLVENSSHFDLIQSKDKINPNQLITLEQLNSNPKKDGFVKIKIQSIIPELYINTIANYKYWNFLDENHFLKDNEITLNIPLKDEFENTVTINCTSIYENTVFNQSLNVTLKKEEPKLEFEIESFRSKIEPGKLENWSFKLNATNTKLESEILASMYDKSLDQFANKNWDNLDFNDYNNYYPTNFKSPFGFQKTFTNIKNLNSYLGYFKTENEKIKLMWFGFNFNNSQTYFSQNEYQKHLHKNSSRPQNAKLISGIISSKNEPLAGVSVYIKGTNRVTTSDFEGYYQLEAAAGEILVFSYVGFLDKELKITSKQIDIELEEDQNALQEVVVVGYGTQKKSNLTGAITSIKDKKIGAQTIKGDPNNVIEEVDDQVYNTAGISIALQGRVSGMIANDSLAGKKLSTIKARTNLSETAFFFPNLKTNSKGKISFNFTSPEALTSWKLRLLAHNKNAVSGYLEKNVITQKELMVVPNFPRFFREKDSITISAKIANMTNESKTGIAMLQFYDATTMQPIDSKMLNSKNIKNFSISAFGNTTATWKVYIPEDLQGVQYKIVAKAGNYSDGEESILPVLTNNILVTESRAIWVRENSTKIYTFENLKNNTSTTLKNHQFTLEYTSNPTWLAIQSLPYLMEYEHECAEQTFARFYSNELASKIISSNPKIAALFETWRKNGKLNSKLEENETLKSIILAETPWLKDAQSEEEKKKNLALLFDLEKMKNAQEATFTLLKQKQDVSGGFAWFEGNYTNEYITRHILAGLGHLAKLFQSDETNDKVAEISKKGIPYLDNKFLKNHANRIKNLSPTEKFIWINPYSDLHYLYTRSFYLDKYPLTDTLKKVSKIYLETAKKDWLHYSLYEKGLAALTLNRFGEKEAAKTILTSLKETASNNEDWGMYWIENKAGWYWYQAPIETQALLIEAFSEISNDNKSVDAMKVWLLKNKQSKNWPTTKSTTEAVYALLLQGTDWLSVKDNTVFKIGNENILTKKLSENEKEAGAGYLKLNWQANEIQKNMATITIQNKSKVPGFGGVYWQYFEDLDKIKTDTTKVLAVSKELYLKKINANDAVLTKIDSENQLQIGDLVTVRILITAKENMEFVHLKDLRASCFEPEDVISAYDYKDGLGFYKSTKDAATHFFFDKINKGTYVLEYDVRVNNSGHFSNGITTIQSMYAPEFSSHTEGIRVKVK
ncbi:hypothetical protein B6A10_10340 [Flavobacterium sp. L1I52]|uniref:Alpha-2-macroglobulin domain-containing protein n=1 Tax=Flavobacterium pokkalii TaxID=1940408 RepID=A0ABR7USE9_9FLAO|nr:MG2 domain-containing protein [Flavobacterium pokkalii]MBD0725577.1 hypothetical protein [Flavobacterium pokkalii]